MREELLRLGEAARRASRRLMTASSGEKDAALPGVDNLQALAGALGVRMTDASGQLWTDVRALDERP